MKQKPKLKILLGWVLLCVFGATSFGSPTKTVYVTQLETPQNPNFLLHGKASRDLRASPGAITSFSVVFEVPEGLQLKIKRNEQLSVMLPLSVNPKKIKAKVVQYEDQLLHLKFKFPAYTIEGMTVSLNAPLAPSDLFIVPLNSIVSPLGKKKYVFLVDKNRAVQHEIKIIDFEGPKVLVKLEPSASELSQQPIITSGHYNLMPMDAVEVRR